VSRPARLLEKRGISVWYSRIKIKGVQEWHDEIGKALAKCNWFVLVSTPSSVACLTAE
jgi:TIR domain